MNLTFTAQPQPSSTVLMWEAASECFYEARPVSWLSLGAAIGAAVRAADQHTKAARDLRATLRADVRNHAAKVAESVGIYPA